MTVPNGEKVDCKVKQGATEHTWRAYGFGLFSDWVQIFEPGPARISILQDGKELVVVTMPLTPGPLVVALRADSAGHIWPPTATSIETIAASYVPAPRGSAGVRLFNLAPGVAYAGFRTATAPLATNVAFSVGSQWATLQTGPTTFVVYDAISGETLATVRGTAPLSPDAATVFLIGSEMEDKYALEAKVVNDAPFRP
eukprot:SAG31_NODE_5852_length_2296_cov_0.827947_2_plen_198_part_00